MAFLNYDKVKGLVYTEKSNKDLAVGKYHFFVDKLCTKKELMSLIKKIFKVEVKQVNVINTKSRSRRFKGFQGQEGSRKKMIVTLKEGQSINFASDVS